MLRPFRPASRRQWWTAETSRRSIGRLQVGEQWKGLQLFVSARNRERNVLGTRGETAGLQA